MATTELLREERVLISKESITSAAWREENIALLRAKHRYYTEFAIANWQEGKDKNIKRLIKAKKEE